MESGPFAGRLKPSGRRAAPRMGQRDRCEIQRREEGFLLEDLRLDDFFEEEEAL